MRKISMGLGAVLLVLGILGPVYADLINFESGFTDQQEIVAPVNTPTNSVTFWVKHLNGVQGPAYIAEVGGLETAFVPNDTPIDTSVSGSFFLTDEKNGPLYRSNYYMSFATPVRNLSLNLYDYRVDGGPGFDDSATLKVFDQDGNPVGTDVYTIERPNPDNGSIVWLSIMAPSAPIKEAWLVFSTGDVGTGIDNITFTTVPLPPSLLLMGFGLLGLAGLGWRRKKAS